MRLIDTEQTEKRWFTELHGNFKDDYAKGFQAGLLAVIRQEAIEAEPVRHRTWVIKTHDDGYGEFEIKHCPDCDRGLPTEYDATYCPNCGAKMDGKESK